MTQATVLDELKRALEKEGRTSVEDCTLVSAAATLKPAGKGALSRTAERAFKSSLLGPFFSRYSVSKGKTTEASQHFDCRKLSKYHFHVTAPDVHCGHGHPLGDWMDKLKDYTGAHSLAPAPLVPWFVYSGTIMHAISCCLVGAEMYWHALSVSASDELLGERRSEYEALLGSSDESRETYSKIVSSLDLRGKVCSPGSEVEYHPLLLQASANVLGRVIVLFDPFSQDSERVWPPRCGFFVPWEHVASTADELESGRQPPIC
eukprot:CAMPEP_0181338004 /NCGR_PEP_ID=MMETSP1101-20121128/28380_1 /TAXON_ID=46948 /ORGANISM="Rhodomonas abbreviata, Strain Caron Lab Isolate" /LENGTH=261 /DNA_ID=CAMNT_0023448655 /DNA_START=180 /DNA_END=962 /DNA_ORIENTATION=+